MLASSSSDPVAHMFMPKYIGQPLPPPDLPAPGSVTHEMMRELEAKHEVAYKSTMHAIQQYHDQRTCANACMHEPLPRHRRQRCQLQREKGMSG